MPSYTIMKIKYLEGLKDHPKINNSSHDSSLVVPGCGAGNVPGRVLDMSELESYVF